MVSSTLIDYLSLGPRKGQTPDTLRVVLFQGHYTNLAWRPPPNLYPGSTACHPLGFPIFVLKVVILPNLVYDKMRSLYNITKSSIDLPPRGGVNCGPLKKFTVPGLFVTFWDPLASLALKNLLIHLPMLYKGPWILGNMVRNWWFVSLVHDEWGTNRTPMGSSVINTCESA